MGWPPAGPKSGKIGMMTTQSGNELREKRARSRDKQWLFSFNGSYFTGRRKIERKGE
jgi:hypothetical protein